MDGGTGGPCGRSAAPPSARFAAAGLTSSWWWPIARPWRGLGRYLSHQPPPWHSRHDRRCDISPGLSLMASCIMAHSSSQPRHSCATSDGQPYGQQGHSPNGSRLTAKLTANRSDLCHSAATSADEDEPSSCIDGPQRTALDGRARVRSPLLCPLSYRGVSWGLVFGAPS
jgi:hypothetical protein